VWRKLKSKKRLELFFVVAIMGNSLGEMLSKSKYKKAELIDLSDFGGGKEGKITVLPTQIGGLRCCQKLDVSQNLLGSLPREIGRMPALRILMLSDNKLTELPDEIGDILTLEELYLDNNKLFVNGLPNTLGMLSKRAETKLVRKFPKMAHTHKKKKKLT
jgi:Leucine rich repeat